MTPYHKTMLCLVFGLSNLLVFTVQRPVPPLFIRNFDANGDGQVDIGSEIEKKMMEKMGKFSAKETSALRFGVDQLGQMLGATFGDSESAELVARSDADGDGQLSLPEFIGMLKRLAQTMIDANGDGMVTEKEYDQFDRKQMAVIFKKYDKDADGLLSFAEMGAFTAKTWEPFMQMMTAFMPKGREITMEQAAKIFPTLMRDQLAAADLNRDGRLGMDEFMRRIGVPLGVIQKILATPGFPLAKLIDAQMVKEADLNGDGYMNFDEEIAQMITRAAMKSGDANGDGKLTEKEFTDGFMALEKQLPDD